MKRKVGVGLVLLIGLVLFLVIEVPRHHKLRKLIPIRNNYAWMVTTYVGPDPLHLSPLNAANKPLFTPDMVTDIRADFIADPFMVRQGGRWWLFVELQNHATSQGDIGVASSTDGKSWHYERIVLDEPFHLSYPYVFESQGQFYMIPEAGDSGTLRLYRATEFPFKWQLDTILLKGLYLDSSIAFHDNRWWLFTTMSRNNDQLSLFYADNLRGPWLEHPKSPIVPFEAWVSQHISRPGGRVLELNGNLVRFVQDCNPNYGRAVNAFEVTELSTTAYAERRLTEQPIVGASGSGWNAAGMHTVDAHRLDDGTWLASVDGYRFVRAFGFPPH